MTDLFEPQIGDLCRCVEREIKLRERVYPRRVAAGHMGQGLADRELNLMRHVLKTLERVRAEEAA